jgi:uncharacterized phosphosugar-binding protein
VPRPLGLADEFLALAQRHLAALARDARDEIAAAGAFTAERVAAGGRIHHFDTGHTAREPVRRAGGLVALHAIEARWDLAHDVPGEEASLETSYYYDNEEMGRMVAARSRVRAGDVLWLVSNSGKEPFPVALALGLKERGCAVVAVTSVAFSRSVPARHASGRRLFEVADRVVDTRGPVGDASVAVEGLATPICPMSGILNVAAVWALEAATIEALLARGVVPQVYRSVNLPDGFAFNAEAERRARERGI